MLWSGRGQHHDETNGRCALVIEQGRRNGPKPPALLLEETEAPNCASRRSLVQVASSAEVAAYDTPARRQIRVVDGRKAAPKKRIAVRGCRLRTLVTSALVQLPITERDQRVIALQERWDGLRQARAAFAAGDYAAAMRTGLVCRKLRTVLELKRKRLVTDWIVIGTPRKIRKFL